MSSQTKVSKDKLVQFTYYIQDSEGNTVEQFDLPMTTVFMRHNRLYSPVEEVMLGASVGDEVSADLLPKESPWGEIDPSLTFTDSTSNVPQEFRQLGAEVKFENDKGEHKVFTVVKIDDKTITLDANHPFAGKVMRYFVKILSIRDATEAEIAEGVASGTEALATTTNSTTIH